MMAGVLHFLNSSNREYVATNDLPAGVCVLGNAEELIYEASAINSCVTVNLAPGCYRAELRGGMGGGNSKCLDFVEQQNIPVTSAIFSVDTPTVAYVFRGGDGMGGKYVTGSSGHKGAFGGGSSGVDSLLVVGDNVWRAAGGVGQTCSYAQSLGAYAGGLYVGAGVGGGSTYDGTSSKGYCMTSRLEIDKSKHAYYVIGGGGGGAPTGAGLMVSRDALCPADFVVDSGANATASRGGDGGSLSNISANNVKPDERFSNVGGRGGDTVTWQCGGAMAYSYGGGGGGATIIGNYSAIARNIPGGDGGSGSSGASDVSFIRIYKI